MSSKFFGLLTSISMNFYQANISTVIGKQHQRNCVNSSRSLSFYTPDFSRIRSMMGNYVLGLRMWIFL